MLDKIDIQKLQALPIEEVASALGLSVSHHKALCPFHQDSHPSLTFSVRKNRYKCYVCDAHGGVIDLVMHYEHKTFLEACKWLADENNLVVSSETNLEPRSLNLEPKAFDASRYERYFARPFLSNEARHFLFEERLLNARVVQWCRLTSWNYKKWGSSITEQVLNLTADEKRQLQTALSINLKPENKVYRYNYFYDNCTAVLCAKPTTASSRAV